MRYRYLGEIADHLEDGTTLEPGDVIDLERFPAGSLEERLLAGELLVPADED